MKVIINEVREWVWSIKHGDLVPLIFIFGGIYVILAISAMVYTSATDSITLSNYTKNAIVENIELTLISKEHSTSNLTITLPAADANQTYLKSTHVSYKTSINNQD